MPVKVIYCPRNRHGLNHCPTTQCDMCNGLGIVAECNLCHGKGTIEEVVQTAPGKPTRMKTVGCSLCKGIGCWPVTPGLFDNLQTPAEAQPRKEPSAVRNAGAKRGAKRSALTN